MDGSPPGVTVCLAFIAVRLWCSSLSALGRQRDYFEKIRVLKAGYLLV